MGGVSNIVMTPLGRTLAIIILLAVFTNLAGAINTWFLLTEDAGVVNGERLDRVVGHASSESANEAWDGVTEGTVSGSQYTAANGHYYKLVKAGSTECKLSGTTNNNSGAHSGTAYTPSGEPVATSRATTATSVKVDGCKWDPESQLFQGILGGLIKIILNAAGLGLPIGAILALSAYGTGFMGKMGISPLLGVIVMVIGFLLVSGLLSAFVPFIDAALQSLDGDRFAMYESGLGSLGETIGNFWGVTLVAGLLYVAWQVIAHFRGAGSGAGVFSGGGTRM